MNSGWAILSISLSYIWLSFTYLMMFSSWYVIAVPNQKHCFEDSRSKFTCSITVLTIGHWFSVLWLKTSVRLMEPGSVFGRVFDTRQVGQIIGCTHIHVSDGKGASIALLCFFDCIRRFTDQRHVTILCKWVETMFCILSCVCVHTHFANFSFKSLFNWPLSPFEDNQLAFSTIWSSTANTPLVSSCMLMSENTY